MNQAEKQGAAAEQLYKELYGEAVTFDADGNPVMAEGTTQKPEPTAEQPAKEEAQPADKTVDDPNNDSWKQRYLVLRGKYHAEVPRLNTAVRELRTKVDELTAQIAKGTTLIKPEEMEKYGPEFIDMVKRAAEEISAPLKAELAALKAQPQVHQDPVAVENEAKFFAAIEDRHPDWASVNEDQKFLRWLGQVDPRMGAQRQSLVNAAVANFDSDYLIDLLNEWKALNKAAQAPAVETVNDTSKPKKPVSPEPSTVKSDPPKGDGKKIWTVKEIERFYAKWRNHDINDVDAQRIEQDIDAARSEGRITK